jgi:hypothetical protein
VHVTTQAEAEALTGLQAGGELTAGVDHTRVFRWVMTLPPRIWTRCWFPRAVGPANSPQPQRPARLVNARFASITSPS